MTSIEEQLYALPEDPDLAFVRLEELARQEFDARYGRSSEVSEYEAKQWALDYMCDVLAAAEEYGISELLDWKLPAYNSDEVWGISQNFRQEAKHVARKLHLKAVRRDKGQTIAFDAATKLKLRRLLENVRQIVDKLEISQAKKERFYNCIEALELEIGKERTRLEAYGDLAIEAATIAEEASSPLAEAIRKVGAIFGLARAQLPAPRKPRQLEAPKPKKIEFTPKPKALPKCTFEKDLDDEIPF